MVSGVATGGAANFAKSGLKGLFKVAKLAHARGFLPKGFSAAAKIVDSAASIGIKTKEALKDFFDVSKHLENEIGAVGNGVEDLIKAAGIATQPVANMKEFFQTGFGTILKQGSEKTSRIFQGQKIHKVTDNIPGFKHLKKGDLFYLDNLHKDHIEVFSSTGKFKQVLNLDGSINIEKTAKAIGRVINVD